MGKFIGDGYIRVNKFEDGKYTLDAKVRGDGGGWLSGVIAVIISRKQDMVFMVIP